MATRSSCRPRCRRRPASASGDARPQPDDARGSPHIFLHAPVLQIFSWEFYDLFTKSRVEEFFNWPIFDYFSGYPVEMVIKQC